MTKRFFRLPKDLWFNPNFTQLSAQARLAAIFFLSEPEYASEIGWKHLGSLLKIGMLEASLVLEEMELAGLLKREKTKVVLTGILQLYRPLQERAPRLPNKAWEVLRAQVFSRDKNTCVYCGMGENLECDHIVPVSRGGSNELDNLATACERCNQSKGQKLLSEWPGYIPQFSDRGAA